MGPIHFFQLRSELSNMEIFNFSIFQNIVSNFMQAQLYQLSENWLTVHRLWKWPSNLMTPKHNAKNVHWQTSYCKLPEKTVKKSRYILEGWKIFKRNSSPITLMPNLLNYILFYFSVLIEHTR